MTSVFGGEYANSYDLLYSDKNYTAECSVIDAIINEYGLKPSRSILDLGCGTGNHALPLAQRGYEITGVDRSDEMLARFRRKARETNASNVSCHSGDICSIDLGRTFDAALMMFAVLGYQLENAQVLSALRSAWQHLNPGGLLVFDVWYGPAVLHLRPSERAKVIPVPGGEVLRSANGTLNIPKQTCTVNYELWRLERNRVVARISESHQMRYFFPLELDLLLETAGFSRLRTGAFPDFTSEANETTWNVLVVARKV
jgi:SAM-dependent methyltransferase